MATSLSETIFFRNEFFDDFVKLTKSELSRSPQPALNELLIKRLLESSAILSLSNDPKHRKLAYRMAIFLLRQEGKRYSTIPFVTQLVLARLGDLPSIQYMVRNEGFLDYFHYFTPELAEALPELQRLYLHFPEILGKKIYNQSLFGTTVLSFTDFQTTILDWLQNGRNVAFSAPTSSGKSFLIMNYLAQRLAASEKFAAIYLVPTKALMAEVQVAISNAARTAGAFGPDLVVLSSPNKLNFEEIRVVPKKVLVLTQERLQEMLANQMNISTDLLILDEAQKIAEGDRGIIIEDAVRELIESNPSMQRIVISPNVGNLDKFSAIFDVPKESVISKTTSLSPVGQSILFVKFSRKLEQRGTNVEVSAYLPEFKSTVLLETLVGRKSLPTLIYERKAWVARFLAGENEPTLIYCNGPSDTRKVGRQLLSYALEENKSDEVQEAIDFLKKHVHPQYYLTDLLGFGVGYHYGKMPQFIRFFVKDLFEQRKINFLCCTSTLLEGVNLPAKNLVIYKPRAGGPLSTLSTRNLVGRAGRLQKDYYGKIFCIEDDEWSQDPTPFNDELESIRSSSEEILLSHASLLIEYLDNYKTSSNDESMKGIKSFATSLIMRRLLHSDSAFLSKFKQREDDISQETIGRIATILERISSDIASLDRDVMLRNRSVDPRFQHELYRALKGREPIPLPPDPTDSDFYLKLESIFQLISVFLFQQRAEIHSYRHYTYLANSWINQSSYKEILEGEIRYHHSHPSVHDQKTLQEEDGFRKFVNDIIEKLDDDLEDTIKYDFTRALKCYADIVEQILKERNEEVRYCKELPLFLEAGARDTMILRLLDVGLSRNTAIEIARSELLEGALPFRSISEAVLWIKEHLEDLHKILHPILYGEVIKVVT